MNKQTKTKLQFILGGILMLTFAFTSCNNGKSNESTTTEVKTNVPKQPVKDTMDSIVGDKAPTPGGNGGN